VSERVGRREGKGERQGGEARETHHLLELEQHQLVMRVAAAVVPAGEKRVSKRASSRTREGSSEAAPRGKSRTHLTRKSSASCSRPLDMRNLGVSGTNWMAMRR